MSAAVSHVALPDAGFGRSLLADDAWLAWNESRWNLRAVRVAYTQEGKQLPRLEGVLYVDRRGRVRMPPANPYLPFAFTPTDTERRDRVYGQWVRVAGQLADELAGRGVVGRVALSPGPLDGRPFRWAGLDLDLRYTFGARLPVLDSEVGQDVRAKLKKAQGAGYVGERTSDWEAIASCLDATEDAQSFRHPVTRQDLAEAAGVLGTEALRGYVVRSASGEVASGGIVLHREGGTAVGWVQGTNRPHLRQGANQLFYRFTLDELAEAGATYLDFAGGNIKAVATAKADWGVPLVPYLLIGQPGARALARTAVAIAQRDVLPRLERLSARARRMPGHHS